MSGYEDDRYRDGDHTAVHEPVPGQQTGPGPMPAYMQQQQSYPQQPYGYGQHGSGQMQGYGYGGPSSWGMRPRRQFPIETKPFFLTSEFVGAILAIAGIAITAAASPSRERAPTRRIRESSSI